MCFSLLPVRKSSESPENVLVDVCQKLSPRFNHGKAINRECVSGCLVNFHGFTIQQVSDAYQRAIEAGLIVATTSNIYHGDKKLPDAPEYMGKRCAYCRTRLNKSNATKDHLTPKIKGGPDEPSNLVWSCKNCNLTKGNRTPRQWASDIVRVERTRGWLRCLFVMAFGVR